MNLHDILTVESIAREDPPRVSRQTSTKMGNISQLKTLSARRPLPVLWMTVAIQANVDEEFVAKIPKTALALSRLSH